MPRAGDPDRGRLVVVAAGNPARGDDGAGAEVLRLIAARRAAAIDLIAWNGDAATLIEHWRDAAGAWVVDAAAIPGAPPSPGCIRRFEAVSAPLPARTAPPGSSHALGVADAIELARALGALPRQLVVYSIEGRDFAPGAPLAPEVAEAAGLVAAAILAEIAGAGGGAAEADGRAETMGAGDATVAIEAEGAVQGVGFRPFVYRMAAARGLRGWVKNTPRGVTIMAAGPREALGRFMASLSTDAPGAAVVRSVSARALDHDAAGRAGLPPRGVFEIRESERGGTKSALVLPDLATCPACLRDVFDPADRRYRYPFTNCTHCGPRFSIIESLPYDRSNTTMKRFTMCPACRAEYEDPVDRRFHAEPNACPACGPRVELRDAAGHALASEEEAVRGAARAIREGAIVALKGIGGYQLLCDARSDDAVERLRRRKHREEKPFALMFPSLDAVLAACEVDPAERELLLSRESPIVLLRRRRGAAAPPEAASRQAVNGGTVSSRVAPGCPRLGVMLPTTALHHILLGDLGFPVVATSGNRSDEPMATGEADAVRRLGDIADLFLVHDRPIARHVDDSVVRVSGGAPMVLRRARGYAPLPLAASGSGPVTLALGGHLKNTVGLAIGTDVFVSQHIGDLGTAEAWEAFRRAAGDLPRLYDAAPALIAVDAHPDYGSTRHGLEIAASAAPRELPVARIQHHHAHVVAAMAEHGLPGPVLGVAWDGTGWGPDGTIWGGEFLVATAGEYRRVAHLRTFAIAGGDAAMRQPRRAALGLLTELYGAAILKREDLATLAAFTPLELNALVPLLVRHEPAAGIARTSSVGRLFDVVASILDLRQRASFEGQAAMEVEFLAGEIADHPDAVPYPFPFRSPARAGGPAELDWAPLIEAILDDSRAGVARASIVTRFHASLAAAVVRAAEMAGERDVVLTGGCFQNERLTVLAVRGLEAAGFRTWRHGLIPPNDGGLVLGQVLCARAGATAGGARQTQ